MSLLSAQFVALACAAVLVLPLLRGVWRTAAFGALNAWFIASFVDPYGALSIAVICGGGFAWARAVQSGRRWVVITAIATLTAAFVYLRGYDLLAPILPGPELRQELASVGLSFLFFKVLHVVVDSAGGTLGELRLATYLNYCLSFTTFLMGPIQRYQDFAGQWSGRVPALGTGFEAHLDALNRTLRGLVKAFVLAKLIAPYALNAELDLAAVSRPELLGRIYAFYAFLYCDFSGYCDVVIGVGSLMGVRPPENFDLPFLARNVADYWLRVHRSLTLWLTDYVFNPTYGTALRSRWLRGTPLLALALSLMLTMLVSGLWHGTTSAFLVFGLLHGAYLVSHRVYGQWMARRMGRKEFARWSERWSVRVPAVLLTFNLTSLAYVFFVLDLERAVQVLGRLVAG